MPLFDWALPEHDAVEGVAGDERPLWRHLNRPPRPPVHDVEDTTAGRDHRTEARHVIVMPQVGGAADPLNVFRWTDSASRCVCCPSPQPTCNTIPPGTPVRFSSGDCTVATVEATAYHELAASVRNATVASAENLRGTFMEDSLGCLTGSRRRRGLCVSDAALNPRRLRLPVKRGTFVGSNRLASGYWIDRATTKSVSGNDCRRCASELYAMSERSVWLRRFDQLSALQKRNATTGSHGSRCVLARDLRSVFQFFRQSIREKMPI